MNDVKAYYDKTAHSWAEKRYTDESMLPLLEAFVSMLPPCPRILDLCCGAGYESGRLRRLGAQVAGLDFSEASIAIARAQNPGIPFYVDDMLGNYTYTGTFDGIVVIAGLVHLPNDALPQAFASMARVLLKGGLVLCVVRDGTGKQPQQSYLTVNGEAYDRAFYAHTLSELQSASKGMFTFVRPLLPDETDIWKNYVFARI